MGELSPVIEGHVKYREGKKWKPRYARIIRLSPVADSLTLQLWRDGREAERGVPSTKGSVNLNDYIGAEVGFNLDKEANTIALIFREIIHILALDDRETLMKWQVRLGHQLEEGQQFPVHLVTAPKKARLGPGPMRIHLQNLRFSLTQGVPPALINTWDLVDLRRYGAVEGGRFCFEGGTRCGKGEGLHVLRADNPEDLQISFDLAAKARLENKKRAASSGFSMSTSPSVASSLCGKSELSLGPHSSLMAQLAAMTQGSRGSEELLDRQRRSRSRSVNTSCAWSSMDGSAIALSSPDTLSLSLSEVEGQPSQMSPDHLVSRRAVLERIQGQETGHTRSQASSRSCGSEDDFYLNWAVEKAGSRLGPPPLRRQASQCDRSSVSSGESAAHSTYDHPKTVLKVTSSPLSLKRAPSSVSGCSSVSQGPASPLRRAVSSVSSVSASSGGSELSTRRMVSSAPCSCGPQQPLPGHENYDIPRNLGRQEALQFYDTPRNVREAIEAAQSQGGAFTGPMGNYDTPQAGALPVFRKPCGCVLKLTSDHQGLEPETQVLTWVSVSDEASDVRGTSEAEEELRIPRVRLTGQGRMPVVDMSKINASRCFSEPPGSQTRGTCPQETRGLPPPHPASPQHALYAQVNKGRKTKAPAPVSPDTAHTNYTNLEFVASLPLYENSRDVLSRVSGLQPQKGGQCPAPSEPSPPPEVTGGHNYLNMSPKRRDNYEMMSRPGGQQTSPAPGSEGGLYPLCESVESLVLMCDSRYNTIKQMPRPVTQPVTIDMTASYHGELTSEPAPSDHVVTSGYVTMPRQQGRPGLVSMRRSASVPCKRPDRDSTSSGSDSGVSTGSPRQSLTDQLEFIK